MIRHIVLFKFKNGVTQEEKEGLARELRNLGRTIDRLRSIEVEMDVAGKHNSYDMALNSLFDNMEDVNAYAVHPAHVKALDNINRLCQAHVKVDYGTKWVQM